MFIEGFLKLEMPLNQLNRKVQLMCDTWLVKIFLWNSIRN